MTSAAFDLGIAAVTPSQRTLMAGASWRCRQYLLWGYDAATSRAQGLINPNYVTALAANAQTANYNTIDTP